MPRSGGRAGRCTRRTSRVDVAWAESRWSSAPEDSVMTSLTLSVVLTTALAASSKQDSRSVLHLGAESRGVLPVQVVVGRNTAEQVFELDAGGQSVVSLTLESLDFDARMTIVDASGAGRVESGHWMLSNVWVVRELGPTGSLVIRVGA